MGPFAVTYTATTPEGLRVSWRDGKRLAWLLSVVSRWCRWSAWRC